jgi:YfiR/HmsC-like
LRTLRVLFLVLSAAAGLHARQVSLEYQLKAAYLFNFVKFIEWPPGAAAGPLVICVAGHNPFGGVLEETIRGESVNDRMLSTRVISMPDANCHVVFLPYDIDTTAYLRAARDAPTLTVGESPAFIAHGGIVNFIAEEGRIRFQISQAAAARADLRISSHLLRLARNPDR